jgi:stearoyl-CoA desaturase (delta-9 desaturase)
VTHITIVCVTLFLHRGQAHKGFIFHPILGHFMRFWLWMTTGMVTKQWVAIHRKHHRYNDTENDPHSPKHKGWFWTHFLSMYAPVEVRYVPDLLKQKFYVWQHKHYFTIVFVYALILYFIDPFAVVYALLIPAMLLWNGGSTIVSISHREGGPYNDMLFVFTIWGEGYHKNHHDMASAKRFGKYDLGGVIIEFIEKWNKPKPVGTN